MPPGGSYAGSPKVTFLPDGREFSLLEDFSYTDPNGETWTAPQGARADGASIPRVLWPIMGGPLEGEYRDASIIHDFYCSKRHKPWKAVHRVFYDAMLTSGVQDAKALLMYAGVYMGGPRWTEMDVHNAALIISKAVPKELLQEEVQILRNFSIERDRSLLRGATSGLTTKFLQTSRGGFDLELGPFQDFVQEAQDDATEEGGDMPSADPDGNECTYVYSYPVDEEDVSNLAEFVKPEAIVNLDALDEKIDLLLANRESDSKPDHAATLEMVKVLAQYPDLLAKYLAEPRS